VAEPTRYDCPFCDTSFVRLQDWRDHRAEAHKHALKDPTRMKQDVEGEHFCPYCEQRCGNFGLLIVHLRTCSQRDYGFKAENLPQAHIDLLNWELDRLAQFEYWLREEGRA
jgi:hypothetical protein